MFEAAVSTLAQMASPAFRRVLLKSVALSLVMILLIGIGLHRLFVFVATSGAAWAESGIGAQAPWQILVWVLSVAATLAIITGGVFLMPAVTAFVGSFFADEIAAEVERTHYPADPPGKDLPLSRALLEGVQTALLAVAVYLCALPFLLIVGLGFVILFLASAYLLGREYFLLAAMRFRLPHEAKALRRAERGAVFLAGLLIAIFVSIPLINLSTPLFATALMVHVHKRLSGKRAEVIEPAR